LIFFYYYNYFHLKFLFSHSVADPYYAYQEHGWRALPKGMASGVTGVLTKPMAGMLGMMSKTAEGIKATTSSRPKRMIPIRLPRHFGAHGEVVPYHQVKAFGHNLLLRCAALPGEIYLDHYQLFRPGCM
jgi:hypothetical protein